MNACMILIDQVTGWDYVRAECRHPKMFIENLKKIDMKLITGQHIKKLDD